MEQQQEQQWYYARPVAEPERISQRLNSPIARLLDGKTWVGVSGADASGTRYDVFVDADYLELGRVEQLGNSESGEPTPDDWAYWLQTNHPDAVLLRPHHK